ncbi:MAG TPA: 6,7-dimethyl-8-ribityllumazine synthase [Candidatus Manganitrophaceae bacterium]|nr:6,7-dimethyl-8-ribityllumazine synthase [Candidatus Manganitrophaceae bacterium]
MKGGGRAPGAGGRDKKNKFKTDKVDVQKWEGETNGAGLRFGIVVSRFNQSITDQLLRGALRVLEEQDVQPKDIEVAHVPGAFEISGLAKQMGLLGRFDALICLGAVIQGETPHFHYICAEVSRGIGQLSLELGLPVIFGVLTTNTLAQALARSGREINKGREAAMAAIEMAHLYKNLK